MGNAKKQNMEAKRASDSDSLEAQRQQGRPLYPAGKSLRRGAGAETRKERENGAFPRM